MNVELLTSRLGNGDQGIPNKLALQALSLKSLVPSNDPSVAGNEQLSLTAGTTGTIHPVSDRKAIYLFDRAQDQLHGS